MKVCAVKVHRKLEESCPWQTECILSLWMSSLRAREKFIRSYCECINIQEGAETVSFETGMHLTFVDELSPSISQGSMLPVRDIIIL